MVKRSAGVKGSTRKAAKAGGRRSGSVNGARTYRKAHERLVDRLTACEAPCDEKPCQFTGTDARKYLKSLARFAAQSRKLDISAK